MDKPTSRVSTCQGVPNINKERSGGEPGENDLHSAYAVCFSGVRTFVGLYLRLILLVGRGK